jgi:hypothetical protein
MNAFESDRSAADASTDPSVQSWLYRSEGFAEDLDELVPAVLAPIAAVAGRVRAGKPALRWPSAWGGGWPARPLGAR